MIRLEFALRTVSGLNVREHHMVRSKRVKAERDRVRLELRKAKAKPPGPLLVVRLTRISPGNPDDDGAIAALKGVRDQVASWLGVDDGGPLVKWVYNKEKGSEMGVRVEVVEASMVASFDPWVTVELTVNRPTLSIGALPGGEE